VSWIAPYYSILSAANPYTVKNACFYEGTHCPIGNGWELERYVNLAGNEYQAARLHHALEP
jgi:hypothetical protein